MADPLAARREGLRLPKRSDMAAVRAAMRLFGLVVAEVDTDLRYVWIDSPHPDFDAAAVIGKRDDEIIPPDQATEIMALKQDVLARGEPLKRVIGFHRSDGWRFYSVCATPLRNDTGAVDGMFTVGFDTPGVLRGHLPICAKCKKIRDEQGAWQRMEEYVQNRTQAQFTHGMCPDCMADYYGTPEGLPRS